MDPWHSGFQPKSYVTNPQELFGYNEPDGILDQLCLALGSGTNTQVLGERNAGKTSVLQCVATWFLAPASRHLPVYLEFHETSVRDWIGAYRHIVAKVHAIFLARLSASEELRYGRVRMSTDLKVDHYAALQALNEDEMLSGVEGYFQQLNERGYGVLLLFDEYEYFMRDVLQETEKFWRLREVAQMPSKPGSPSALAIALAGASQWSKFCRSSGSPPLNIVSSTFVLSPLSRKDFGKMWEHCREQCGPQARSRLDNSGVTIDQVYRLAGGWAYFGKAIGQHVITCGRLDRAGLALSLGPHFRVLWEQRTDAEREQLLTVARGGAVPLDALADLRQRGLVDDDGQGRACLRGALWAEWVKAQLRSHPVPPEPGTPAQNLFRREDDCYRVRFKGGTAHTFAATDGFHYLAVLLSRPQTFIDALELEGAAGKTPTGNSHTEDDEAPRNVSCSEQEVMDEQALKEVRKELEDVMECIAEIKQRGFEDFRGQSQELENKKNWLLDELEKAVGLGGRRRTFGSSPQGKAYDRVRHALEKAYEIMGKKLRHLEEHLRDSIKGKSSSFAYYPAPDIKWEF